MSESAVLVGITLEEACLTLEELAAACAVEPDWVALRVTEGLISASGGTSAQWRFSSAALQRVKRMRALERDFEAVPELAALFADLLEELDAARARLRSARIDRG
jgi:chaperone modulatory protein CbpM